MARIDILHRMYKKYLDCICIKNIDTLSIKDNNTYKLVVLHDNMPHLLWYHTSTIHKTIDLYRAIGNFRIYKNKLKLISESVYDGRTYVFEKASGFKAQDENLVISIKYYGKFWWLVQV